MNIGFPSLKRPSFGFKFSWEISLYSRSSLRQVSVLAAYLYETTDSFNSYGGKVFFFFFLFFTKGVALGYLGFFHLEASDWTVYILWASFTVYGSQIEALGYRGLVQYGFLFQFYFSFWKFSLFCFFLSHALKRFRNLILAVLGVQQQKVFSWYIPSSIVFMEFSLILPILFSITFQDGNYSDTIYSPFFRVLNCLQTTEF